LSAFTDQSKDISIFIRWIKRKSVGFEFLTTSWQCMIKLYESASTENSNSSLPSSMRSCLRIIAKMAPHLQVDQYQNISNDLIALVGSFSLGPELLGAAVSALVAITRRANDPEEAVEKCSRWVNDLYQRCEEELSSFITAGGNGNEVKLVRAIFLTGELTMIGFRSDEDPSTKKAVRNSADSLSGFFERPSQHLFSLGQTLLAKSLPLSDIATPEAARAHAFVALGKLCLRDEAFAKRCLNLLARELHQSISETCASVQSNALLVMGDLCVKYTNLVDRYLPVMASCLQTGVSLDSETSFLADQNGNGAPLVRKHAVLMLSSLLLQDYIKWRGLMFHRFLVATADEDEGVSKLAEMTLCGPLLGKFPKLFLNNFVESLFVLNRCTAHPIYLAAAASGDSGSGIAVGFEGIILRGAVGRARRLQMYKLMLSKMSDEDKIGVIARLAKDVLGAALDSSGDLGRVCRNPSLSRTPARGSQTFDRDESALNVLSDAFSVLTCPSIKVGRAAGVLDEDESVEEFNKVRQMSAAKGNLMVKISRKQLIEIVLPIVCRLKSILQSSCSPLLKEIMRFMSETFRAYKSEVRELLANDPTLLQEVEYDSKQFCKSSMQSGTPVRELFQESRSPESAN
jgi:condensin-2 complex subunit D3